MFLDLIPFTPIEITETLPIIDETDIEKASSSISINANTILIAALFAIAIVVIVFTVKSLRKELKNA